MKVKLLSIAVVAVIALAACAPAAVEESEVEAPAEPVAPTAPAQEIAPAEEMQEQAGEREVSFSRDIWPVIEEYALPAHGGSGGVFLESYEDIMNYVVPGDPENSRLYKALTGDGERQMPPTGRLPDDIIQLFYDWIAQGAPNN